jgi:hypothetical protein
MIRIGPSIRPKFFGGGTDADAQAFITAAAITDATQQSAINTLVVDLKAYGIWTKMKALYPFVGGTASAHKFNLKDPRDLDAAFRLVFSGGWTHSSNGATPNGTNAFANTYLTPSTTLGTTFSLSYYSNTDIASLNAVSCEIGIFQSVSQMCALSLRRNLNVNLFGADGYGNSVTSTSTNSNFYGICSRTSTTSFKLFKNNTLINTNTATDTGSKPTIPIYLALQNGFTGYSNRRCALASIGDGLTDTEVGNLYTAVQAYQTTLSRNV